jgi:hypothetical protein
MSMPCDIHKTPASSVIYKKQSLSADRDYTSISKTFLVPAIFVPAALF